MQRMYFEDIEPGTIWTSSWYTVSREEIIEFAKRWDPYAFHIDEDAAKDSIFGSLAACTAHIFAISSLLNHDLGGELALVAGLGGDGLQLLAPVRAGDRVRLVRRFTQVRASRSRPESGIVSLEDTLESPDGEPVFRTSGSILLAKRDSHPA